MTLYTVSRRHMNCVDKAIRIFRQKKNSMRCGEAVKLLEGLGFTVEPKTTKNHKSYLHEHIQSFMGSSFSCPHKKGEPIRKCYVVNILKVLDVFKVEIDEYLNPESDDSKVEVDESLNPVPPDGKIK